MRRAPMLRLLGGATLVVALALPSTAGAADAGDPAALIEQGLDLRQAGRDAEALALFESAQALAPSPRGQAQVALAQQALGRWLLAERNLRAALAAKSDPWIESRRPILERAMTVISSHLGDVEIVGATGGVVFVDGVRIAEPDALTHLRLEVGRRTFELRSTGDYPFSRILEVLPGETVRVEVEQHPLLDDRASPPAPAVVGAVAPSRWPSTGGTQRTVGWVALGGAGLFLATGVAGLITRSLAVGTFNSTAICTTSPPDRLPSQCKGYVTEGTTGDDLAIVGFVGAGASAVLSTVLLLTARKSKTTAAPSGGLSFPCGPVRGGVACAAIATF